MKFKKKQTKKHCVCLDIIGCKSLRDRLASPRHCETERPETETRPRPKTVEAVTRPKPQKVTPTSLLLVGVETGMVAKG